MSRASYVSLVGMLCWFWLASGCAKAPTSAHVLKVADGCDAAQSTCSASGDGIVLRLRLGPDVRILQSFAIDLQPSGDTPFDAVSVDFVMQGMDMGYNHYVLKRRGRHWLANATIPVCVSGRMDWFAEIRAHRGDKVWLARFPFVPAKR